VVNLDPVVCDGTDEDGHHHHVLVHGVHLGKIFFLEKVEGKVVGSFDELNSFCSVKLLRAFSVRLLH
jgi:glucose dehydrogenase